MSESERIAVLNNPVEAQLLEAELMDAGIPHVMRSYHDLVYDGLFQFSKGWGHVEAPVEHREEILHILEGIRQGAGDMELEWQGDVEKSDESDKSDSSDRFDE